MGSEDEKEQATALTIARVLADVGHAKSKYVVGY
jgi:hypothetical protein